MKRKFLMGVALLTSAVIMLVGCGKAAGGSETSQEGTNEQNVSVEDNTGAGNGDKVTLKLWIPQENEIDYETCAMTQYLEEKFNVNLDFDVYTHATDRDTAFNLLIAGEEYPDIFTGQFSPNQITMAAEAGKTQRISKLLRLTKIGTKYCWRMTGIFILLFILI